MRKGWRLMANKIENEKPLYLSTGIKALNEILAMDVEQSGESETIGGILIGKSPKSEELETPVILINGETGAGKTTLMLQIAFSAAAKETKWLPCFCSLEQTVRSLKNVADSFMSFQEVGGEKSAVSFCDLAENQAKSINFNKEQANIYLCHLSPRPISGNGNAGLFEIRLAQLNHIIENIKRSMDGNIIPVFFLDSINAFSTESLGRNEIYRLFSLFRNHRVPAVLSMEHHMNYDLGVESDCVQNAKFLSDIVISLTKDNSANYLKYYLEIEKSRVSRQALGKHIYKIRTFQIAKKIQHDPRTGIVLYPSIHSVLSRAREQTQKGEENYFICEKDLDLQNVVKGTYIKSGECFSIIGPPGTHKLALGMNLALGHKDDRPPSLLIVNFGGSGDIKFDGVAWTQSRQYCNKLVKISHEESEVKFWNTQYSCETKRVGQKKVGSTLVTTLSFRIGHVTPEECFYVIDKVISETNKSNPLSSVLLSDTAELCNGFPLLASDSLFLPALIDLFAARKLVTVCLGVDEGHSAKNSDTNFSLSSRADYRIVLSHYPSIHDLSEQRIKAYIENGYAKAPSRYLLTEQLVSLVVDNVTGKHYGREPRWLYVKTTEKGKELHCDTKPDAIFSSADVV
jgi:KaiC/GvpD/RAD55 family RecA-like ATPase